MSGILATSAGGVVYRKLDGNIQVLLVRYASRQLPDGVNEASDIWEFPKGTIGDHGDETLEAAALREVREESGVNAEIVQKVDVQEYEFDHNGIHYHKSVHFFLMQYVDGKIEDHDREVVEVRWFDLSDAEQKISFENNQETFRKAKEFLR